MTKKSGFTLIEVLSSTAILSILLIGAVTVFTTSLLSQSKARVRRVIKLEGEQIISTIEFELKNAQSITNCVGPADTLSYTRAGDPDNLVRTIAFASGAISLTEAATEQLNSDRVTITPTPNLFNCEENAENKAKFISVAFDLTNAQAGEINTDAGSITESFRTGVSFRNFKAN